MVFNVALFGFIYLMYQAYLFRGIANNVKGMYASICKDSLDCGELIWSICTSIVVWYLHMN